MSQQKFGRYIIKGTLGRGAMGMVYLALDPILDRLSAIKVMNTGGEVDEGLRTRFFREAKSAARLRHPNIIAIYEMGEEDKKPFIAMEYVEGEDLKSLIEKRTFIPFEQKIRILVQVCEALSYAHQQGVIHRDIKPANVRIAQDGEVRLLDFGLARLGSSDITRTGMLMGTPYYMSPEQVRGVRDLDGRSDLFSAAVLFYELLSYARPFEAESSTEVCLKIVSEPHAPLASVLPKVDADLVAIIDRALSKNRDARQADCQELALTLKTYAQTVPQRLAGLESEVARLEKEWKSCCDASQHLVKLGILEESLLAPPSPSPAPPIDPEETTVYNFSVEASRRDFGALLLTHARLHGRLEEVRQRLRAAVPLQELFERGQQQREQNEFQGCLKTLAEILEMVPENARALEMHRECQRLLEERRVEEERRTRLKQALALASEALAAGNLAQGIQSASRALQIDPGNRQAQELKQQASEALVRRRKVAELLAAARGFHKAQNYESACQVCAEGLALDPAHAELRLIQQQSQQILERQTQIREWLRQAQESLQAGDYLAVLTTTDQLLTLEPDLPRALEMQQQAAEALERQLKLDELVAEARGCEMAGDFEECLRVCDHALQISPENPEILGICERASQTLAKQRRVAELLSRSHQEIERTEFALAMETCREAIGLDPANHTAQELLQTAEAGHQRRLRVAELFALAQSHQHERDFQSCLNAANEALALDQGHRGHLDLHRLATDSLERLRQFQQHLETARNCDDVEDYARALEHLERALDLDGDNADAVELKQQVSAKLDRRNQLNACLESARQHFRSGNYAESLDSAQRALQLDEGNAEAREFHSRSSEALARLERESQLLAQARRLLAEHQYEKVIGVADELLRLNPHHAGAQALKQEAVEAEERRQRFEACLVAARNHSKSQDYSACLAATTEALEIEPQHGELRRLQEKAVHALEMEQRLAALLDSAERGFKERRFVEALDLLNELLSTDASHAAATRLKEKVSREWQKVQQVEQLLGEARNQASQSKWEGCRKKAQEGLKLSPNHEELQQLQDRAQQELEKLKRIAEILKKSRAAFEEHHFEDVSALAAEILQLDPGHREALDLRGRAVSALERQRQICELLQAAQAHQTAQEPQLALRRAGEGRQLDPANVEFLSIERWATDELERVRRVDALLYEAQQQASDGQWEVCRNKAQEGLQLSPSHEALQQIRDQAQRELEKRKRVTELLKNCRALLQQDQFEGVLTLAGQILELEPGHVEAAELRGKATAALEHQRRVRELLEAAEAHERFCKLELALEKARAGLQLEPRNTEFLAIQSRTAAALEHQRRVSALLSEARQQLGRLQYEASLRAAEELLKLEREHPEGHELKQAAASALERLKQLNQSLTQAKAKAKAGLWEEGLRVATEGLRLDPTHAELTELASQASEILDKRRTLQELLDSGRGQFGRGEHEAAIKSAERVLQLSPDNAEAAQLKQQAQTALEAGRQKERVAALLAEARKHQQSGDMEACYRAASEGLTLEPEHSDMKALRENSGRILETRRQVQILLERARQQWQAEDLPRVVETAVSILKLDPENAKAADFKLKAEQEMDQRRRLKELLSQARQADEERDHEACLRAAEEGLALDSGHPELQRLQSRSRQMLEQIRRMAQLLQDARAEIEAQNYAAALKTLDSALKLESTNAEAAQLKQNAQEALERHKRLAGLRNDAQRYLKAGQLEACLESASQGLAMEADHPLFKELVVQAQRQLELRRRIEEALKRASQHHEKKEYQPAIAAYDSVLTLAPGQVEAVEGRKRAHEALQRQQRLKECLVRAQKAFDAQDFQTCNTAAEEGLRLDAAHPALQDLAKKAAQIIERTRRVQQLWNEASQNQQKGELPGCLRSLDLLLELDPENAEALELRPKIVEALERQRRAAGLLAEAASLEKSGDLEASQRLAEQALQIDPKHSQAEQFHQRVSLALERRRQIQKLLEQAGQRFEEKDDAGSLKVLEELLRLDPGHPRALEIQSLASKRLEHRKQVEQLLVQARKAQEARDPEKCLQAAEQGLQLEPAHVEFKKLQAQSREQLARQRKMCELVSECQRQLSAGALEASIAAAQNLESLDPGNTIAAENRQKANEGLERRRRVQALLARALELSAAGDLVKCHSICGEALQLDPSNTELLELRDRAFQALESRRREEELRARLQQFLASAKDSLQLGRFRAAQRDLTALLKLDAAHAEARRLLGEAESQLVLAREKNLRLARLAVAAVLAISLLGSGIWYGVQWWGQKPGTPPNQTQSSPAPAKPQPSTPEPPPVPSKEDQEVARLLDTSLGLLREKKYAEAEKGAGEVLARSPNHADATRIKQEARKSLEAIDVGLGRARALLGRKQYAEVASALGGVLAVDANNPEALRLMSQVDKYARNNAEDARKQMERTKQQAGRAGARSLVQNQYQIASVIETEAARLFQNKKFGEATGKFYEASNAYRVAEGGARTKAAEMARESAPREKPAGSGEVPPAPVGVDRQQEEREREVAQQRNQAQSAWNEYLKAVSRASQTGAERFASDIYHQATSLGTRAQEKFNQGSYAGAQADFGDAIRQIEHAIVSADEVARQRRLEEEKKQKEPIAEQAAAQSRREPQPQISGSGQKADDRELVFQVLRRYEAAINHQSMKELGELWPSLGKEEERKIAASFKFAKSQQCELQPSEPRITQDTARVDCQRVVQLTTPDGKTRRNESKVTVTLRKKGGNWIIEAMQ